MATVTPRSWATSAKHPIAKMFQDKELVYLDMNVSDQFPTVKVDITAHIFKNAPSKRKGVLVFGVDGEAFTLDPSILPYIPNRLTRMSLQIFNKVVLSDNETYNYGSSQKTMDTYTGSRIIFLRGRFGYYGKRLIVEAEPNFENKPGAICKIDTVTEDQASVLEYNLRSKLHVFLFDLLGGNGGLGPGHILRSLPTMEYDEKLTDEAIYKMFDLDDEEIGYIEARGIKYDRPK